MSLQAGLPGPRQAHPTLPHPTCWAVSWDLLCTHQQDSTGGQTKNTQGQTGDDSSPAEKEQGKGQAETEGSKVKEQWSVTLGAVMLCINFILSRLPALRLSITHSSPLGRTSCHLPTAAPLGSTTFHHPTAAPFCSTHTLRMHQATHPPSACSRRPTWPCPARTASQPRWVPGEPGGFNPSTHSCAPAFPIRPRHSSGPSSINP